jgi:hypothetical protein
MTILLQYINDMKMFKIKAMHHNIIVIQVLDRVYNGHNISAPF